MRFVSVFTIAVISIILGNMAFAEDEAESNNKIRFSGSLEEEFGYIMSEDNDETNFSFAKAELCTDIPLGENVSGHLLILYEQGENDNKIIFDEGTIDFKIPIKSPAELSLSIGRMVVPFGEYNSHFVTDPFALEIGETKEAASKLSASINDLLDISFAVYNDEVDKKDGNFHITDLVVRMAALLIDGTKHKGINLSTGISLITNMAGTDGLTDIIGQSVISKKTLGLGNFVSMSVMGVFFEWEALAALTDIETSDGVVRKPWAFNIELGYSLPDIPIEIAGKFEHFKESDDNSISRYGGLISLGLFEDEASLALEFLHTDEGQSSVNTITGQLAIEF